MEVISAFWVPKSSPFLVSWVLFNMAGSSSIGSWLVAESSVAEEFMWAKFPADFTIWFETVFAWRNTVVSDSYFTNWASALVNADTSSVCLLPASVILFLVPELGEVFISTI